jgi:hypothetical protein
MVDDSAIVPGWEAYRQCLEALLRKRRQAAALSYA